MEALSEVDILTPIEWLEIFVSVSTMLNASHRIHFVRYSMISTHVNFTSPHKYLLLLLEFVFKHLVWTVTIHLQ